MTERQHPRDTTDAARILEMGRHHGLAAHELSYVKKHVADLEASLKAGAEPSIYDAVELAVDAARLLRHISALHALHSIGPSSPEE